MSGAEQFKGAWTDWLNFQSKMLDTWMNMARTGMKAGSFPSGLGSSPSDFYQAWKDLWTKGWAGVQTSAEAKGLGEQVYDKIHGAASVYNRVMSFWGQAMVRMAGFPVDKALDLETIKTLQDGLRQDYRDVMNALWGLAPTPESQESLKALLESGETSWDVWWGFLEPSFKHLAQVPGVFQKFASGDTAALSEIAGIFRKTYHDTIGRSLRSPSLGYFRESLTTFQRTVDAYVEYQASMQEFHSLMFATSQKAMEKVLARLTEFSGQQPSPQMLKEFYRLWLKINEDTYHDLFLSKEFTKLLQEVLTRGLQFRKWLDDLSDQLLELTNLPGKKDMDEIYKTIYELKKEVRGQRRRIQDLEQRLAAAPADQP